MSAESQLSAAICVLVEHGAGVAIIDQITATYAARRVVVKPFEPTVHSGFSLVTSNQHPPSQLATAFVAYTKQRMIAQFGT